MLYRFEDIEKSYGPHDVLRGVTWQHNPGEKVGLVGRNGAGKTTLFKLLLNEEEPDRGQIIRASGLTIGHISQHLDAEPGMSLFDYVETAFAEVLEIERKMRAIEHDLSDQATDHERLLEKYAALQHDYEHANGYKLHAEVERVLTGVGFTKSDWERPIHEFSGGQQNRAMLARVLLTKVDLLLLDEPTNHLDLNGIEFLEEFLQSFKGSFLLISHDRTFLNRTIEKIVELAHGKLIEYHGNYERFLQLREERIDKMATDYERQQEFIERTQEFIRRNIAGLQPLAGSDAYGHNVRVGYYDQTRGDLDPLGRVIDEVWNLDHTRTEEQVRNYLAQFSFFDDDVFKKTRDLSGGERGRLALAKIMYVGGNVMLLDEPTNHLDVYTREALEEALERFTGALVVVSHDRYFIDRIAENIILVEDGRAEVYAGNYTDLVERMRLGVAAPRVVAGVSPPGRLKPAATPKPKKKPDRRLKKIDDEISALEERIANAERERERNDQLLCSEIVYRDGERMKKIQGQNADLKAMIDLLYGKWEALSKEREEIQSAAVES